MTNLLIIFLTHFFIIFSLQANLDHTNSQTIDDCQPTQEIMPDFLLNFDNQSNNLLRKTGSPIANKNQIIKIQGFITDLACRPITNARVEIWHVDSFGVRKVLLSKKELRETPHDPYFTDGGRFYTDNLGRFEFLTIMPGSYENRMSHINFKISHQNFADFFTIMFFPDNDNNKDERFANLSEEYQKSLLSVAKKNNEFLFNITLPSNNLYKKY